MKNCKIPYEKSRSRQHYTSRGKCKESYDTKEDADRYIVKHKLYNMNSYFCRICNKYHIGHHDALSLNKK